METIEERCSKCHVVVRPTDYFCYNCGNNLKPTPPSISITDQLMLYTKSILLPPFGLLWAIKYLKQDSGKSKIVGIVAIILTFTALAVYSMLFIDFSNKVNEQVNEQLNFLNY